MSSRAQSKSESERARVGSCKTSVRLSFCTYECARAAHHQCVCVCVHKELESKVSSSGFGYERQRADGRDKQAAHLMAYQTGGPWKFGTSPLNFYNSTFQLNF